MSPRRLSAVHSQLWSTALWTGGLLGAGAFFWLGARDEFIWRAAGTTVLIATLLGVIHGSQALLDYQQHELDLRARATVDHILNEHRPFVVYGTRGYGPVVLVLLVMSFWYAVILPELSPTASVALLAPLPLTLWFWMRVAPRLFPPLVVFEADGLNARALGKVRWSEIAGVSLAGKPIGASVGRSYHALILEFVDGTPRAGASWYRRRIRGVGDHQEHINLVNASESKAFVRTLAELLVVSAVSERRAALDGKRTGRK